MRWRGGEEETKLCGGNNIKLHAVNGSVVGRRF